MSYLDRVCEAALAHARALRDHQWPAGSNGAVEAKLEANDIEIAVVAVQADAKVQKFPEAVVIHTARSLFWTSDPIPSDLIEELKEMLTEADVEVAGQGEGRIVVEMRSSSEIRGDLLRQWANKTRKAVHAIGLDVEIDVPRVHEREPTTS